MAHQELSTNNSLGAYQAEGDFSPPTKVGIKRTKKFSESESDEEIPKKRVKPSEVQ
jgi:hypothetical protein